MESRGTESWIWKLVEVVEDHDVEPLADSVLQAYRSGELPVSERERVEQILIRSSAHRVRLIEMAGDAITQPPAGVWERLRPRRRVMPWRTYLAAAARAAGRLLPLALWVRPGDDAGLGEFAEARFEVRLEGTSDVRSESVAGVAHADSAVQIWVESLSPPIDGLHYGLYRLDGDRFQRVPEARFLRFDQGRGAALIQVAANLLVTTTAGEHTVYVVVSPDGDFPDRLISSSGDASADLGQATHGKVYAVGLTILAP